MRKLALSGRYRAVVHYVIERFPRGPHRGHRDSSSTISASALHQLHCLIPIIVDCLRSYIDMPSQVTSSREFQHARYALVLSLSYQIVNKDGPRATLANHIVHLSSFLTIRRFSRYFTFADWLFQTKTRSTTTISWRGRNGMVNNGGTTSLTFAEDGGT